MSKTYLDSKKIYAKNDNNLIYETQSINTYDGYDWLEINLVLVAGYDYINPDENDIQGYVKANKFIEDVQTETVIQYFLTEGMKDSLNDNGYEILDKLPIIH